MEGVGQSRADRTYNSFSQLSALRYTTLRMRENKKDDSLLDCYIMFDEKGVYIAEILEPEIPKKKKKKKNTPPPKPVLQKLTALPIEEIPDSMLWCMICREEACAALEGFVLCSMLNGTLKWLDEKKWFWQSEVDNDLVLLKCWVENK